MPKPTAVSYAATSGAVVGIGNGGAVAAPVAEFIGAPTSGTTPLTVTFTDQTTGSVTSWAWDFGDGGTSTSQNPSHVYSAAGTYTVALTATGPGGASTRTRTAYVAASAPAVVATALVLSLPTSGATGAATAGTVTPNGPAPTGGITATLACAGCTVTGGSMSWAAGDSSSRAVSVQAASGGSYTVTLSNGQGLTNSPASQAYTASASAWTFSDGATFTRGRNTSSTLHTGLAGTEWAYASPDLLPGESLAITGGNLVLTGDPTVPTVDPASGDALIANAAARDVVIEVIDSADQHATAQNMRTGTMYGRGASGGNVRIQQAIDDAADGDTIQISPGFVYRNGVSGEGNSYLESGGLGINKSITLTNIPGRGRWRLAAPDVIYTPSRSGIVIWEPNQCPTPGSKTIVIEGFDFDNFGRNGDDAGVRIRNNSSPSAWTAYHSSVTLRNFKIGKPYPPSGADWNDYRSGSGINGACENLIFEDGHVYDCGAGMGSSDGQEHNFYVTARNLTMRGMRSSRSRGTSATGWWESGGAGTDMDGHQAKLTFNNALIDGSVFDCGPRGDSSIQIQAKGGGNLVVRGCVLIAGAHSQTGTGNIVYEKELGTSTPGNYGGWMFGLEGHSLLIERNVFINHLPYSAGATERAMVYFRPAISGNYLDTSLITSCVIRDNIGMSTVPNTGTLWVPNPPPVWADGSWGVSNSALTYGVDEPHWTEDDKKLMLYRAIAGTIAASGSVATKRFTWPHGSVDRTDAFRGLA